MLPLPFVCLTVTLSNWKHQHLRITISFSPFLSHSINLNIFRIYCNCCWMAMLGKKSSIRPVIHGNHQLSCFIWHFRLLCFQLPEGGAINCVGYIQWLLTPKIHARFEVHLVLVVVVYQGQAQGQSPENHSQPQSESEQEPESVSGNCEPGTRKRQLNGSHLNDLTTFSLHPAPLIR